MVLIGVKAGVVELCVSINPEQLQTVMEMYPECLLLERAGDENIGWLYDGAVFTQG